MDNSMDILLVRQAQQETSRQLFKKSVGVRVEARNQHFFLHQSTDLDHGRGGKTLPIRDKSNIALNNKEKNTDR